MLSLFVTMVDDGVVPDWDKVEPQHMHLFERPDPDLASLCMSNFGDVRAAAFTPTQRHTMVASAKRLYPKGIRKGDPDYGPVCSLTRFMEAFERVPLLEERKLIFRMRLKSSDTDMIRFVRTRMSRGTHPGFILEYLPETELEREELRTARVSAAIVSAERTASGASEHSATTMAPCTLDQGEARTQDIMSRLDSHFGNVRRRNPRLIAFAP